MRSADQLSSYYYYPLPPARRMQRCASKSILARAKRPPCKKSVSFCSEDECRVYRADDYDRTPVAPSRDLSTRDYQELEEVLQATPRERIIGGRVHMPLLPLLSDDAPRSPPASPPPLPRFPSAPARFTSFHFLPVNPNGHQSAEECARPTPPPPPARQFPGFEFVAVVPETDPPPPPPRVPESRPTNFLPLPPPSPTPPPPLTVTFKRQPQHRAVDSLTRPPIPPPPSPPRPPAQPVAVPSAPRSWSPPSAPFRPSSSPPFCAPVAGAPQSSPHTRLRSMAS